MTKQSTIQENNASLGRKDFKFYLSNNSLGSIELTYTPDGWANNELNLIRDKKYHGVMKAISTKELTFIKEGRNLIKNAYEMEGVNSEVSVTIYRYNKNLMKYEFYHKGYIDFSTYEIDETTVSVELIPDGFWDKVSTRNDSEVNLRGLLSIEEYEVPTFDLNKITIPDTSILIESNFQEMGTAFIDITHHVIPCSITASEFNETSSQVLSDQINQIDEAMYQESETPRQITVDGHVAGEFLGLGSPFAYSVNVYINTLDSEGNIKLTTAIGNDSGTAATFSFDYTFSKVIEVDVGDSLILQAEISPTDQKFSYSEIDFDLNEEKTGTPETEVSGFLLYEAFLKCLQLITDSDNPFYSEFFGRTDTPFTTYDEDGELIAVIKGSYFRNITDQPMPVTLNQLFESASALHSLSLNHEVIDEVDKIRVEGIGYAYSSEVVLDLSSKLREENIKKRIYPERIYNKVECGYNKFNYEQEGGLYEWNTKSIWTTVIRPIKGLLKLVSEIRGDWNGIRLQLLTTDPSEDAKGDENNFWVTVRRDVSDFIARLGEDFSYVGGAFYANKSLNLDITPSRNLRRNYNFIRGSLLKNLSSYLIWQSSDKPSTLKTRRSDESATIIENANIRVNEFDEPIWIPEVYEIEVPLTYDEITAILANPRGLIQLAPHKYGWILDAKTKNKDGKTTFELLRANEDVVIPYPIEGAIRFIKEGEQLVTADDILISIPAFASGITIDWGDGVIETVSTDTFSHRIKDGAIVVIYGLVETFEIPNAADCVISHISAYKHATLTDLTVTHNNATVADFRESKALQNVIMNNGSLEKIMLDGCTDLRWLRVYDNSSFTENIDVSECTALRKYENYNCSQSAIDVSTLSLLNYLDCRSNSLTSINLSGNPLLETLSARINNLTALDTSSNPVLYWVEIRANYSLTSWDISSNPLIDHIQADYMGFTTDAINNILYQLDQHGLSSGYCDLEHSSAPSSAPPDGITAKANLISKSWNITTD